MSFVFSSVCIVGKHSTLFDIDSITIDIDSQFVQQRVAVVVEVCLIMRPVAIKCQSKV